MTVKKFFYILVSSSGIFSLEDKPISIIVNDLDHLQFDINVTNIDELVQNMIDLYGVINKIDQISKFAKDSRFGFLSSCPKLSGTGFNIYSSVRLNKISDENREKIELISKNQDFICKIVEKNGENQVDVMNINHFGITEKESFEKWNKVINELLEFDV